MAAVPFDEIRRLFHAGIDAAEVTSFLARYPDHLLRKPSDGQQYVLFRSHGFDLLFRPLEGLQRGRSSRPRVLTSVFLFRAGEEKHEEFRQPPFGVAFANHRDLLVQKLGLPYESSLSRGWSQLAWEKWRIEDLTLHAMYHLASMTTRTFTVSKQEAKDA